MTPRGSSLQMSNVKPQEKDRTYLENRLRMRPLGVVSKKVIGLLKMACAILSCNFREAYRREGDLH